MLSLRQYEQFAKEFELLSILTRDNWEYLCPNGQQVRSVC